MSADRKDSEAVGDEVCVAEPRVLALTAVNAAGRAWNVEFPMHPHTHSVEAVSHLAAALLDTLAQHERNGKGFAPGDILQALSIVLAVRGHMLADQGQAVNDLQHRLLTMAQLALAESKEYSSGRA